MAVAEYLTPRRMNGLIDDSLGLRLLRSSHRSRLGLRIHNAQPYAAFRVPESFGFPIDFSTSKLLTLGHRYMYFGDLPKTGNSSSVRILP